MDFAQQSSLYEVLTQENFKHCPAWLREDLVEANGGGDAELTAIISEIDQIADAFDAIGDLVTSESVYQIVQGIHVRAAAIVKALADGKAVPDPQIVRTPRTGTLVNHRVVLCLDSEAGATANGWTTASQRSQAAPALNQWVAEQLEAADSIRISVYVDEVQQTYTLDDFGLQAVDLLYLIHPDPDNPNSPLVDLITYTLRTTDGLSVDTAIRIDLCGRGGRLASWER